MRYSYLLILSLLFSQLALASSEKTQKVKRKGKIQSFIEDYPNGQHKQRQYLKTEKGAHLELQFSGKTPTLPNGKMVQVEGLLSDGKLSLNSSEESILMLSLEGDSSGGSNGGTPQLTNTFGEQRVLVMLVNFEDKTEQPYTQDFAKDIVFNQVNNFIKENSFGQTWLVGDVTSWLTLPLSSVGCPYNIGQEANKLAISAGYNLENYNRYIYVFPKNGCGFSGQGSVGGDPSYAYINESLSLKTTAHELGHNFGLGHSHSLVCNDGTIIGPGQRVAGSEPWQNCTRLEYGDGLDIMGWSKSAHYNAPQKERLGWLNYGASPEVITIDKSGSYLLEPYALAPAGGVKVYRVLKDPANEYGYRTWYYIEYRQAIGFDSVIESNIFSMDSSNVLNGVTIHAYYEGGGNSIYLLDMTTDTTSDLYTKDPALTTGNTYTDETAGVTITTDFTDALGAQISVTVKEQVHVEVPDTTPPTVAITSPQDKESVTGNQVLTITADAQDNKEIARVEFYVNQVFIGSDNSAPYSYNFTIPKKGKDKLFTIEARAIDSSNLDASSTITVLKDDGGTTGSGGKGNGKNR